jgi:hypothetical protein
VADLPVTFGPWQTVWKRHRRFSADGTWDQIHTRLLVESDSAGQVVWDVSVDSTVDRAHQHATNLARVTGGPVELHNLKPEPADHALGRSRGGLSTENPLPGLKRAARLSCWSGQAKAGTPR